MQRHNTARPTARLRARAAAACIAVVVTSVGVTACGPGRPDPDTAAQALADGISSGDLADVPLSGSTPTAAGTQLAAAIAGLDPLRPAIVVGQITVDDKGEAAEAPLAFTWDVDDGDQDWTYSTTAHLDLVEDEWVAQWSLSVVSPDLVPGLVLATHRVAAERANVLGADGVALVEPRPVLRLGVDKTRVDAAGQPEAARQVAELLGLDPGPYAERVAAAGVRAFVEALVVRTENPGVDLVAFAGIAGALSVEDVIPLSPSRRFARPILGSAGLATAEIIAASDGAVVAGDTAGLSGLQLQYDAQLRGRPGLAIVVHREDTGDERELFRLDPVPGEPLVTTLDPRFQDAAESVLEPVGPASAIVALRSSGEVLAAASGPGGEGYSTATLGTYAPGSSFKVVGSLALLRAGLTPDSPVECPASITVDGRVFNNFPDYPSGSLGSIPLRTAVAQSCNTCLLYTSPSPRDGLLSIRRQRPDVYKRQVHHRRRSGVQQLPGLPVRLARQHPAAHRRRPVLQHRLHRLRGPGVAAGPGRCGSDAGPRRRAAAGVPGLPRVGPGRLNGYRPRGVDDRPGPDRGVPAGDGHCRGIGRRRPDRRAVAGRLDTSRGGRASHAADCRRGRRAARPDARRRHGRRCEVPAGRPRTRGAGEDRHGPDRFGRRPAQPRLDDRGAGRPGRRGLRGDRRVRVDHRRASAGTVPHRHRGDGLTGRQPARTSAGPDESQTSAPAQPVDVPAFPLGGPTRPPLTLRGKGDVLPWRWWWRPVDQALGGERSAECLIDRTPPPPPR